MYAFIRDNLSFVSQEAKRSTRRGVSTPLSDASPQNPLWSGNEQNMSLQQTAPRSYRGTSSSILRAEVGMPRRQWSLREIDQDYRARMSEL